MDILYYSHNVIEIEISQWQRIELIKLNSVGEFGIVFKVNKCGFFVLK